MRKCSKCLEFFPATTEYFYRKGKGFDYYCKTCRNKQSYKYQKQWRHTPEGLAVLRKARHKYYKTEKGQLLRRKLNQKYWHTKK